ncbi:MAG: cytochrome c-type biogenesis protein CcmH [Proteobacteria bacterium]|nr:MAG: cytochrome c-type biogenesis protein CcmH [Pseudomonadota bacterium]
MRPRRILAMVLVAVLAVPTVVAPVLTTPALAQPVKQQDAVDSRVFAIGAKLRCPVCQSETILDSHSSSAKEMLRIVREQIEAGRSDAEIVGYFHDRYGDYVLMQPPARGANHVLWVLPLLILLLGGFWLARWLGRSRRAAAAQAAPAVAFTERDLERLKL